MDDNGHFDSEFDRNIFSTEVILQFRAEGVIRSAAEVFSERLAI